MLIIKGNGMIPMEEATKRYLKKNLKLFQRVNDLSATVGKVRP